MSKAHSQYNPLRLPKTPADFEAIRRDKKRPSLGITGTSFAAEEATVVISTETTGWHYMDVEYATFLHKMLGDSIKSARRHNRSLSK
ncbi:hypothetical protein [Cryobacterium zhongshanensis]|jgi:hypothetical protein|uniref:Uncharacterized protein n=1 Tax=Cryobacterium zhongshanensis TaxID=2928153 RepID=A0AA41QXW5_9MICO|nr:hypothetical protein [Cryobacterium zhongshanensis]MCI4659612.1 hypothetical protein [Cryobacterium zhongshanensis]